MLQVGSYVFKRATTHEELHQVHALNHRTFVGEIPQHSETGTGLLVDKFHDKNTYLIALEGQRLIGMVSVHHQPPFSVADRLPDTTLLSQPGMRPMEVRLLAIEPSRRNGVVFGGLIWAIYQYALEQDRTHLFISGFEDRVPLYEQIGFAPVGPPVQGGNARFVPMMVTVPELEERNRRFVSLWTRRQQRAHAAPPASPSEQRPVCLLPGPVAIAPSVHAAFHRPPLYHRGVEFTELFEQVRHTLAQLTQARGVAILNGSGTLANEVVGATLSADAPPTRGLLLVNGEFGERIRQQAVRFGLRYDVLTWPWGEPWHLDQIEHHFNRERRPDWVWGVHQESSTGVLNPLPELVALCRRHEVRVCMDCVSSLGATPLDLSAVYLASGASGKALGAFAGAAILFADPERLHHLETQRIPSYFDLPAALACRGPRFTFPSPTLAALAAALREYDTPLKAEATHTRYRELGVFVRTELRRLNVEPLAHERHAAPVITTFSPPSGESAEAFVARCHFWGFAIGGQSGYLAQRRLVQIATMGAIRPEDLVPLFHPTLFHSAVSPHEASLTGTPS